MQARNTIQLSDWIVNLESQKQKPKEKLVVIEERKISKGKQKEKKKKKISKKKQELIDARNAEMIQELLSELVDRAIFLVTGEKEHFKSEEEEEESENVNVSGEFVEKCKALIATLVKLQTKSFATYTGDLAYKRIHRYYSGIRQVEQSIRTHKSLLVLIASDLPKSSQSLLSDQCQQSNVPYAILWTRKKLARLFQCKGKVSAVSIINVNGIDQQFVQTIGTL
jgi:ribosomal protein L7Ae-like RNA K-turn-binding protein